MVNKKELKMQRIELLWTLSGTHTQIFFLDLNVTVEVSNRLTLQISRFQNCFTGQTPDRTNCLTPLAHTRRRVIRKSCVVDCIKMVDDTEVK